MWVRVSVVGGDQVAGLESLDGWLRGEPELAGRVRMSAPRPGDGELGAVTDVLMVAVGSGGALSVLATSLRTWLAQPRRSDIRLRVQGENGSVVELAADRVDAEALLRQALEFGSAQE